MANVSPRRGTAAFTLVEMLVVILIFAVIFAALSFTRPGDTSFTNSTYTALGIIQQGQTYAVAHSTYVWIGFFEESPSAPQTSGTGQVVISEIASKDGTNLISQLAGGQLPAASLIQVAPLVKIPNLHISPSLTASNIPNLPGANYQIDPTVNSNVSFVFPLTGTLQYTFQQIIQFSPQGDVSVVYGSPVQVMQLGLIPAVGSTPLTSSSDVSALQISGIGGRSSIYRP